MATISFDSRFKVQEQYVLSFFDILEESMRTPKYAPESPYVNEKAKTRSEELLKRICSEQNK